MWYHSIVGIMINYEQIRDIIQNKNFVMFFASLLFMCGILACFYGCSVLFAALFTFLMLVLLFTRIFEIRKIFIFTIIFYFGFFLTFCKIKNFDDLLYRAPVDTVLTGRIVSIPEISQEKDVKFFMQVESFDSIPVSAKTFVSVPARASFTVV